MRKSLVIPVVVGLAVIVSGVALVPTQDEAGGDAAGGADMEAMQEMMMMYMTPGEEHKHLDYFVGEWDVVTKVYMAGTDGPDAESQGTTTVEKVLNVCQLFEKHSGSMMGMPYDGMGFTGYERSKNLFTKVWVSNMDTQMLTMRGSRDPETGTITMYGEMDEPAIGVFGRMVKYVTEVQDDDHFTFKVYDLHARDDYLTVELIYTRKK